MSTSNTIIRGDDFHLYTDAFDEANVYLSLDNVEFSIDNGEVTLTIPHAIWEVLRQHQSISLEGIDATDDELLAKVKEAVDERIERYKKTEGGTKRFLVAAGGMWVYGSADSPREEQIARGLAYMKNARAHKQNIRAQVLALQDNNN